ncbi:MAG: hypothetical protein LBV21_00245, partial [Candidatus Adiutrix sp.]|nr:hypothetical protein [Candidatus Adiutrix sp.]
AFLGELDRAQVLGANKESWNYKAYQPAEPEKAEELIKKAQIGYVNQDNPELKWRYAFQLIRLYFYQRDYQAAIDFFSLALASQPPHPVKEWCRSYYGGALSAQGEQAAALKEFALVFYRSAYYRDSAWSSFKMVKRMLKREEDDGRLLATTLALAEDDEEAAIIKSVFEYRGRFSRNRFSTDSLMTRLALAEKGGEVPRDMEYGLAQVITELEGLVYGGHYPPDSQDEIRQRQNQIQKLERLVLAVAAKRPCPAFWYLAAAHLAIMREDSPKAGQCIELAVAAGAANYLPKQLALTRALKTAHLAPLGVAMENSLGRQLREIDNWRRQGERIGASEQERLPASEQTTALQSFLETILAARYLAVGRNDRAFFCLAVVNNWQGGNSGEDGFGDFEHIKESYRLYWPRPYVSLVLADPAALRDIRRTMKKPRGEWEKFLAGYARGWTPEVLTELLGLAHIQRGEFPAAARELAGLDYHHKKWAESRYQAKTPGNPFLYSPEDIFGPKWRDEFKNFFEAAAEAGLSAGDLKKLERAIQPPATFFEFVVQLQQLAQLARAEDEAGLTAAYFYALSLDNSRKFKYWQQICHNCYGEEMASQWAEKYKTKTSPYHIALTNNDGSYVSFASSTPPYSEETDVSALMARVAESTQNPELAARAGFFLAGGYGDLRYYRTLNQYRGTAFLQDLSFNCPRAKDFLDKARPVNGRAFEPKTGISPEGPGH